MALNVDGTCDTCQAEHYSLCTCVSLHKVPTVAQLFREVYRVPSEIVDLPRRVELNPAAEFDRRYGFAPSAPLVAYS